jgi:hypothetical protein
MRKHYSLAKIAYDAYVRERNAQSKYKAPLTPKFNELPKAGKDAWWASANASIQEFFAQSARNLNK